MRELEDGVENERVEVEIRGIVVVERLVAEGGCAKDATPQSKQGQARWWSRVTGS